MYHYIGAEVAGGLGPGTAWTETEGGRSSLVEPLHYEFQGWLGDDLVTTSGFWLVSGRLAEALRASALTGFQLAEVVVTLDPQWTTMPQRDDFPVEWVRLVPTGTEAEGANFALRNGTDLLVDDAALSLLRQFSLEQADVDGDHRVTSEQPARIPEPTPEPVAANDKPERPAVDPALVITSESGHDITGHVVLAVQALGASSIEDDAVQRLVQLVGGINNVQPFEHPDKGNVITHSAPEYGIDLRFVSDKLDQVTFHLFGSARRAGYPWPEDIVVGLPVPEASQAQVTALFGEPYKSMMPIMSRFKLGTGHVHFGWTKTGERAIVVLANP